MTITFLTNLVNHHQINVADELFKHYGHDYTYVAFEPLPDWLKKGGYQEFERSYVLKAYESIKNKETAERLAYESDIVIIGSAPEYLVKKRLKENKITFHYSERWFKHVSYRLLSPRYWYYLYNHHTRYRNKRSYMLCASAFTASDVRKVWAYPNKCFKWGYFTKIEKFDIKKNILDKRGKNRIMWCARFLNWKHPELVVNLAERLKQDNYVFAIDMFGSGVEFDRIKKMIEEKKLTDVINLRGNLPNEEILHEFRSHNIFLFTSDRNEGWGAVLNEAMSNGCTVVASHKIGSVPFLIKDGINGFVFKSENKNSLYDKVTYLLNNAEYCEKMAEEAYNTMVYEWSPSNAAAHLINLFDVIVNNQLTNYKITEGPCSWAI